MLPNWTLSKSTDFEILPGASKADLVKELESRGEDPTIYRYCFKPTDEQDHLPGRLPTVAEASKIVGNARECHTWKHEETSWICRVHTRLLGAVLEEPLGGHCDEFASMTW